MSKAIKNAELKRDSIVAAAEALFLRQGYGVTSMDKVAETAAVTKQTVYRYYPSKEELFAAVMKGVRGKETVVYEFASSNVKAELTGYGEYLLGFHLKPDALGLYRLMLAEGANEKLMKVFMSTGPKQVLKPLLEFLSREYPTLDNRAFNAEMFATMILAPRNQLIMNGKKQFKKSAQKEHVGKVVELFLKVIDA